jgi:ubiquinone/menaquinone biosynthesis C-methylase UbiE
VSFYRNQLLPRLQDKVMDREPMREARSRVCATLHGDVVEVGFGTGLNARFYPSVVTRVLAVEPSSVCLRIAQPRIERSPVPVEQAGLTGERLDLGSDVYDAVLSTWTLCTIPDVASALKEMRRVLKPGACLHFVEHGHAPDPKVQRRQRRIESINKRLAGGCHLTRDIAELIEQAGFVIEELDRYYMAGEPKSFGYTFEGRAVRR